MADSVWNKFRRRMMRNQTLGNQPTSIQPKQIAGFDSLAELALDMRWSWNHATDGLWQRLDPELWELTHNAWVVPLRQGMRCSRAARNDVR